MIRQTLTTFFILFLSISAMENAAAQSSESESPKKAAKEVDVRNIKKKYWSRGKKSEIGVVQNRAFSKAGRFQFGVMGGVTFVDPFINVYPVGANIGYYLNEFFGIHAFGYKFLVSDSAALKSFQETKGASANTNEPDLFYGLELSASAIYGKLSILGQKIIYYDLMVTAGGGMTHTETGNYITPTAGIGQRFFITKLISFQVTYRFSYYRETLVEKIITQRIGEVIGERNSFGHTVTGGIDLLF